MLNVNIDGFIFFLPIISYRIRTIVESYALPATGNTSKIARLKLSSKFKLLGFITISKDYYDNTAYASGNQLAIDGVSGAVTEYASTALPTVNLFFPIPAAVLGFLGYLSVRASGTPGNFTFVSTPSALDAAPYTTPIFSQKYVNGSNQYYPSTTETFIAQETNNAGASNNVHIRFTARNSKWLFNEMENLTNLENCSGDCSNPFYIAGPDLICTSGTFTIPGLQRGVIITFTITPGGLVTPSGTGNSITLTRNGSSAGVVTLTASLGAGCSAPTTISRQIIIGNPDPPEGTTYVTSNYYTISQTQIVTPQFWFMPAGQTGYVTYYISDVRYTPTSWLTLSGNTPIISADKRTLYFTINTGQTASYQLTAQGPCGTFIKNFGATVLQGGGFSVTPSPNPATESLKINISNESKEVAALSTVENIVISLYEFNTNKLAKEWNFKNNQKQFSLNVSGLKKGQYILVVSKGKYKQSAQILIDK